MVRTVPEALAELAESVVRARLGDVVDVYLERVAELRLRVRDGAVTGREPLLREGVAVRRAGRLLSADGLDRPVVAALLGLPDRSLPPLSLPALPPPPTPEEIRDGLGGGDLDARWRWSWAGVAGPELAGEIVRPPLLEIVHRDGLRELTVWPPPAGFELTGEASDGGEAPRAGRTVVLLAPAAASVLLHELFGHPLEAEALLSGSSPWTGRLGQRVTSLPLDLDDDPTAGDLPGAFSADDEGVPAAPRVLLRSGELVGVLTDRESGPAFGLDGGNARRSSWHAPPRPRVSNLVARCSGPPIERAAARLEVASISAGTVEPRSGTLFLAVRAAWSLRRGERQAPLAPFTLAASVEAVRTSLLAASDEAVATAAPGWCGKNGELLPTAAVAPWLLVGGMEVR